MISNMLKKNKKGFTLVELMIVVAIIGILAAIAIPAFLRYIKSSKVAEAEGIMKKMADGSKSYMTSEQKYSNPTGGDQPWHPGTVGSGSTQPGLPVPAVLYVFPGGAGYAFNSTIGDGGTADPASSPSGGSKQIPAPVAKTSALWPVLNKLNMTMLDPLYFQYAYISNGAGFAAANVLLTATANFDPADNTIAHTITQTISIDPDSQDVRVSPTSTTFEFE